MIKDLKENLEKTARQLLMVHRSDTLRKLIMRTVMQKIHVRHCGLFILNRNIGEYVVDVSKGKSGIKVPVGFTKIKDNNPIITYFIDSTLRKLDRDFLLVEKIPYYIRTYKKKRNKEIVNFFEDLKEELSLYEATVCIPGFYRDDLVCILFLGRKENGKKLKAEELWFLSVLVSDMVMAIQNAWLIEDLNSQVGQYKKLFLSTVKALSEAIEAKDKYTVGHTERVEKLALMIADHIDEDTSISNWRKFRENLRIAALLHDIGKIAVPESILNKPSSLTEEERIEIRAHPDVGVNILNHIDEFEDVIDGVRYHHERYDGNGYPSALKGDDIPLIASIIAVADCYDAMTTDRPYRKAFSQTEAIEEVKKNSGKQFNPLAVDAFIRYISKILPDPPSND